MFGSPSPSQSNAFQIAKSAVLSVLKSWLAALYSHGSLGSVLSVFTSVPSLTPSPSVSGSNGSVPSVISAPLVKPSLSQSKAFHVVNSVELNVDKSWLAELNEQASDSEVPSMTSCPAETPSPSQSKSAGDATFPS